MVDFKNIVAQLNEIRDASAEVHFLLRFLRNVAVTEAGNNRATKAELRRTLRRIARAIEEVMA